MIKHREILRIAMRDLGFRIGYSFDHRDTQKSFAIMPDHLGECVYTLTTSNVQWPNSVSYPEMREARDDVITSAHNRRQ